MHGVIFIHYSFKRSYSFLGGDVVVGGQEWNKELRFGIDSGERKIDI